MKTYVGYAILALVLSSGAAGAQTTIITQEPAVSETIITREPTPVIRQQVELTPAQRTTIYRTIVKERTVTAPPAAVEYRVGGPVPATAELYTIPETVAVEVPAVRPLKYMYVNNRVVLVDPATSVVVGEIVQ